MNTLDQDQLWLNKIQGTQKYSVFIRILAEQRYSSVLNKRTGSSIQDTRVWLNTYDHNAFIEMTISGLISARGPNGLVPSV